MHPGSERIIGTVFMYLLIIVFQMFVRLFVDENLDRIVPISKQPKEKIQAIIDSCTRQFPEFAERARKRIRTYLKSCRRNKRSRETNGAWDAVRIVRIKTETASLNCQILSCSTHSMLHCGIEMKLLLQISSLYYHNILL